MRSWGIRRSWVGRRSSATSATTIREYLVDASCRATGVMPIFASFFFVQSGLSLRRGGLRFAGDQYNRSRGHTRCWSRPTVLDGMHDSSCRPEPTGRGRAAWKSLMSGLRQRQWSWCLILDDNSGRNHIASLTPTGSHYGNPFRLKQMRQVVSWVQTSSGMGFVLDRMKQIIADKDPRNKMLCFRTSTGKTLTRIPINRLAVGSSTSLTGPVEKSQDTWPGTIIAVHACLRESQTRRMNKNS